MAGMTIDPNKCFNAKMDLLFQATGVATVIGITGAMAYEEKQIAKPWQLEGLHYPILTIPFVPFVMNFVTDKVVKNNLPGFYNIPGGIKNVWDQCGGDGWLKKHLDSAKTKIQEGIEGVKGLVPQPAPIPIPISSYAVSAEAVERRATSPGTVAKGVAVAAAATVVGAVSAALYMVGLREVSMMGSPAGLGLTIRDFPVYADQNSVL